MELLKTINEESVSAEEVELLGNRTAVRAVIVDGEKIALIHAQNNNYYELPGGGAEKGEIPEAAVIRECREETGCEVEIIKPIGRVLELRRESKIANDSHCYLVRILAKSQPDLTEKEIDEGKKVMWVTLAEARKLILSSDTTKSFYGKYLVIRDMTFLDKFGSDNC